MAVALRNWMFTGSANKFVCPSWPVAFGCDPPGSACASDNATGRQYCCENNLGGVCWIHSAPCTTDGSTFNCTRGSSTWCCVTDKEICTETSGQINICWASNPKNALLDLPVNSVRSAYSSLTSAQPSASSYTFDPQNLVAAKTSSSGSSRTTDASNTSSPTGTSNGGQPSSSTASRPTNSTDVAQNSNDSSSSSTLGGSAIAGVVVGIIAAIAIGAGLAWFLIWRSQKKKQDDMGVGVSEAPLPPSEQKNIYTGVPMPGELPTPQQEYQYPQQGYVHPYTTQAGELPAEQRHVAELPSGQTHPPGEQR